ncbi:MAG TPA: hypothetical protein VIB48_24160 [Acidimicrobiia bacterium]
MSARWTRLARVVVVCASFVASVSACAVPPPGGPTACNLPSPAGTSLQSMTVDGQSRAFWVAVPPNYTGKAPVPVVFNFHGAGSNGYVEDRYTQMSVKAAPLGWIVMSPDAYVNGALTYWSLPPPANPDTHFVTAMLQWLRSHLCTDSRRMFATGLSDGAMFTQALACFMPGTFAAIAPVGAINATPVCRAGTPGTPLITFHGTADPIFPYQGNDTLPSVPATVAAWATLDGCGTPATTTVVASDVTHTVYPACGNGTGVELYTILDGGHNWPDGQFYTVPFGRMTTSIDATDIMLRFFAAHRRAS